MEILFHSSIVAWAGEFNVGRPGRASALYIRRRSEGALIRSMRVFRLPSYQKRQILQHPGRGIADQPERMQHDGNGKKALLIGAGGLVGLSSRRKSKGIYRCCPKMILKAVSTSFARRRPDKLRESSVPLH